MNLIEDLQREIGARWGAAATCRIAPRTGVLEAVAAPDALEALCGWLFGERQLGFAGLVVEEGDQQWELRYAFYGSREPGWVQVILRRPLSQRNVPSIVRVVHAADWHEREAEDLYGLQFEGHPRLGDFVLHDDVWQEAVEPMRRSFPSDRLPVERHPRPDWRPRRVLQATGAFAMPIGPVFAGLSESAHFLLETVGEDVVRAIPRLFYKYRGVEKLAEGQPYIDVLLSAERFAATTAFSHALAYCHAVETIGSVPVPERALVLRVFLAELERLRHHVVAIEAICDSTALAVAASQVGMLGEELLRIAGWLTGHRYLFGLVTPGGLTVDLDDQRCQDACRQCGEVLRKLNRLEAMLQQSSSFLDRLEEVGFIASGDALACGLVGPIARASGVARDLRVVQPYGGYDRFAFQAPLEHEGDGYARLRVLFAEARQSLSLMEQVVSRLASGPIHAPPRLEAGAALGWVEAPRGAAFHWLRISEDGTVQRYRIVPPSFINWLGFRLSVEHFAFQDFPIILSTLDLSVAENDR